MIDLSIVIVNYNLAEEIENCLTSLIKNSDIRNYEIIIIDNNSPDKRIFSTEEKFKTDNIKFYYLTQNLGFGKGCNYGYSKTSGRYVCFLNPDTLITDAIFSQIIKMFEGKKEIGIIGPKQQTRGSLLDFSAGFYPNVLIELFNLFGFGVYFEAFMVSLYTRLKRNTYLEVDWILGAAIFIRSELFNQIGGFDKDYFMFFEEVDLCRRVSNKGYKVIYYPALRIHHIGSVSGKRDYSLFTKRIYSSKYIYISKHTKSLNKLVMKSFLFIQLFSQITIWLILYPFKREKSRQKLDGFIFLLKNRMKLA